MAWTNTRPASRWEKWAPPAKATSFFSSWRIFGMRADSPTRRMLPRRSRA
jgi:hypothetical protein